MMFSISRHSDSAIAKSIAAITQQTHELSQRSASFAKSFSEASKQVSRFVLPDVLLAVKESEPAMATSLLAIAEDSIVELRRQGEDMQQQHAELQQSVQALFDSIQSNEAGGARESVIDLLPMKADEQPGSPRSVRTSSTEYNDSSSNGEQSSDDDDQSSDDENHLSTKHVAAVPKTAGMEASCSFAAISGHCSPYCDAKACFATKLEELKKVEDAVEVDLAFWQDMNAMVQKLTQMKHHTACLVQFGSTNVRLCARVEQRLDEYSSAWTSLEHPCQQYLVAHELLSLPLAEFSCTK